MIQFLTSVSHINLASYTLLQFQIPCYFQCAASQSSCTAVNSWHVNLKNRMICKIWKQTKDACTSCSDIIRYFEELQMVVNPVVTLTRSVAATVIAETILGCAIFVNPALPNKLSGGRIVRRNFPFETKPMGNISSEMLIFKM